MVSLNREYIISESKNIFLKYDIHKAYLFGSYSKGTNKESSDIDFIIDFGDSITSGDLIKIADIKEELGKCFHKDIDLCISPSSKFIDKNKDSIISIVP